jgi:serine-type anaerobic sulfatase-maturating enzyme
VSSRPGSESTAFSLLVKPTGASCNLACEYCFYLSREKLYPGSRLRMSDQVLESYIRQVLTSQLAAEGSLDWQGGEPTLMGLDFFKRSVELAERYERPGHHFKLRPPDQWHPPGRGLV